MQPAPVASKNQSAPCRWSSRRPVIFARLWRQFDDERATKGLAHHIGKFVPHLLLRRLKQPPSRLGRWVLNTMNGHASGATSGVSSGVTVKRDVPMLAGQLRQPAVVRHPRGAACARVLHCPIL